MKIALQFLAASMLLSSVGLIPLNAAVATGEKTEVNQEIKSVVPEKSATDPAPPQPSEPPPSAAPSEEMTETDEAVDSEADQAVDFVKNIEGLTLQHRLNADDTPQPIKQVKADPLILLQTFKQDVMAMLQAHPKPLKITSEIKLLFSESFSKQVGELPSVTVQTEIDAEGKGRSNIVLPAYQHEEPAAGEVKKFLIDFKGMAGQSEFTEDFANFGYRIDFSGLTVEEENQYKIVWDKTTLEGKLDADLIAVKAAVNLSKMELTHSQDSFKILMENGSSETVLEKLKNAVEVHTGNFKLGKFELQQGDTQGKMDRLEMTFGGTEQTDKVDFFLNTKFNGALLPKEVLGESLTLHYNGQLALQSLAAEPVVALQQAAREFERQRLKGGISENMMYLMLFNKVMEIAPKLAVKSPELALNDLNLKTNYGQLIGKMTVGLDGAKFKSLTDIDSLLMSLQTQADFTISQKLLQKFLAMLLSEPSVTDDKTPDKKSSKEAIEKQAKQQADEGIRELLSEKWLVEEGENYRFVASLKNNSFIVNGAPKPSPLNDFMVVPPPPPSPSEAQSGQGTPPVSEVKH